MGFVLARVARSPPPASGALIGNVAHGVITGLLFFLAGAVKDRTHTGELAELSGLRETAPRLSGLLGFAAVASLGLPGLAGFWGEAFAVVAAVEVGGPLWTTLAVLAAFGGALTAAYFLRLLRQVTHGGPARGVGSATAWPARSGASVGAAGALALAVGMVPTCARSPKPVEPWWRVAMSGSLCRASQLAMRPTIGRGTAGWCCWPICWWPATGSPGHGGARPVATAEVRRGVGAATNGGPYASEVVPTLSGAGRLSTCRALITLVCWGSPGR